MIDLTLLGAVPAMAMTGSKAGVPGWNFGVQGKPGRPGPPAITSPRTLYDAAPWVQGRWDGKTICCHDAAIKVLGKHLDAQMQPKGTCGGRAAKRGLELLQLMLITSGRRAKFQRVSHAWPYALARKDGGILGPQDGVLDGSIPPVMAKHGCVTFEEAGETSDYGPGSDDLAARWGYSGPPQVLYELARDNRIGADFAQVRSVAEMYDGFAAGGIAIVSDDNGYTMQRDKDGCCKSVREPWYHYHLFSGVAVLPSGCARRLTTSPGAGTRPADRHSSTVAGRTGRSALTNRRPKKPAETTPST